MSKRKLLERYIITNKIYYLTDIRKFGYTVPKQALYIYFERNNIYWKQIDNNSFKKLKTSTYSDKKVIKEKDDFLTRYMKRQLMI